MKLGRARHGEEETVFDLLAAILALALAGLHVYVAVATGSSRFLVIATGFLLGFAFYFTGFWRPVMYLVGALYAGVLGVIWLLSSRGYPALAIPIGAVGAVFVLLVVYLFHRESKLFS